MLDELHDPDIGRQFDQPLLKPHQQVIDLCGLGSASSADTLPSVTKCCLP